LAGGQEGTVRRPPQGASVMEAILSILVLSVLVPGAWSVVVRHHTGALGAAERAEALETVRTSAWLLREELSGGAPEQDWWLGEDTVALRAFRALGLVREGSVTGQDLRACVRGVRMPNPEKDSVLILGADGLWRGHELERRVRSGGECPEWEGAWEERWTVAPEPTHPLLGRIFERGSYHFADGALRYRRGSGGRQPLTPERIGEGRLRAWDGGFRWELGIREAPGRSPGLEWRGRAW
jgi:hypothetical protein